MKSLSVTMPNLVSTSIAWREHTRLSASEVVDLHSRAEYRVACIGFVPGFPFLAGLAKKLATPRTGHPAKGNSSRLGRNRRRANGNLSVAFAWWLESNRSNAIAFVRSAKRSAFAFACGGSRAVSRNYAGRVCRLRRGYGGQGFAKAVKRRSSRAERGTSHSEQRTHKQISVINQSCERSFTSFRMTMP